MSRAFLERISMEDLTRITIGDATYPIKIDLNVLEKIQNEYGSINEFEREILGLHYVKDEEGNQMYEDGKPVIIQKEPSIKAIKTVLPAMINEGLEIEAERNRTEFIPVSNTEIISQCSIPYKMLAKIIHEEFKRCFSTKKI